MLLIINNKTVLVIQHKDLKFYFYKVTVDTAYSSHNLHTLKMTDNNS